MDPELEQRSTGALESYLLGPFLSFLKEPGPGQGVQRHFVQVGRIAEAGAGGSFEEEAEARARDSTHPHTWPSSCNKNAGHVVSGQNGPLLFTSALVIREKEEGTRLRRECVLGVLKESFCPVDGLRRLNEAKLELEPGTC
ncbi:hypothetical protein BY996DRAFT_6490655 [Phakopsora pachyrhizi]|nr:hypothetical protein BY996DRAFT_6490655 [Phakopsora pachyrhizi]